MEISASCILFALVVLITFSVESEAVVIGGMQGFRRRSGKRTFSTAESVMDQAREDKGDREGFPHTHPIR
ncbi:unnamed protein product [Porites evermanni]|uniref:Uncharacterized protein n=1 Tax=Porites evermanni TaxID=104178 RepID=A0ABN8LFN4_9CNID|nr:unnamed protein product [Porites evermanni]